MVGRSANSKNQSKGRREVIKILNHYVVHLLVNSEVMSYSEDPRKGVSGYFKR